MLYNIIDNNISNESTQQVFSMDVSKAGQKLDHTLLGGSWRYVPWRIEELLCKPNRDTILTYPNKTHDFHWFSTSYLYPKWCSCIFSTINFSLEISQNWGLIAITCYLQCTSRTMLPKRYHSFRTGVTYPNTDKKFKKQQQYFKQTQST